jgi:hypothetical protein
MPVRTRILLPAIAALLSQAGCTQPEMDCTSAHGTFAASFERTKGSAEDPCGALDVDILGMQTYFAEGGLNGTPKFNEATVAVRAAYMYEYVYYAVLGVLAGDDDIQPISEDLKTLDKMVGDPDAIGAFDPSGPADGFCPIPKLSTVELNLPNFDPVEDDPATMDVDESDPGQPGAMLKYEWTDFNFVVTPDAQGTQFSANLKFTQDGSVCEYKVLGLYPVYDCMRPKDENDPESELEPSDAACHDEDSPINPDFKVKCSKTAGICILADDPPAYE